MRNFTLGLILALFLVTPAVGRVDMGPGLEPNGLAEQPEEEVGPSFEPGGLTEPPRTEMGPSIEPNG
jgi:hypothetical protein